MSDQIYPAPKDHHENGWASALRTLAIILLLMASWIAVFDHALWK